MMRVLLLVNVWNGRYSVLLMYTSFQRLLLLPRLYAPLAAGMIFPDQPASPYATRLALPKVAGSPVINVPLP